VGRFLSQQKGFFKGRDGRAPQYPMMLREQLHCRQIALCCVAASLCSHQGEK